MSITEKINDIIDRRKGQGIYEGKGHLQKVEEKLLFFQKISELVCQYKAFQTEVIRQIETDSPSDYRMLAEEDPTFESALREANPDKLLRLIEDSINKLNELKTRFNRDTINVSVIGRAGQGKSCLLQSISGLDNAIIPADTGGDCTGAKSVICNTQGPLHATIYCYKEAELLEQVQKYLSEVGYKGSLISASMIPNINLHYIEEKELTNKQESYYQRIKSYVEKYDEYSSLIGKTIEINNPDEIRGYVAQYLSDGTNVYKFLAVREVQIFTPFNYTDAGKIMLVDTIGLGDTSIGLREKMIETLVNDSDAAIMLRRPDPERDGIREEDNDLYDMITSKMKGRDLAKWLFYVLNIYEKNRKTGENLYNQLERKFINKTLKAAFLKKIDCADKKQVETELIIPMLDELSSNLKDVDNSLISGANETFVQCYNAFVELSNKLQSITNCSFKKSLSAGGLFDDLYADFSLTRKLGALKDKYEKSQSTHSIEIEQEIKETIKKLIKELPSYDEILYKLTSGEKNDHVVSIQNELSDHCRAKINIRFDDVNKKFIERLQENFKKDVIDLLRSEDGGKLDRISLNLDKEHSDYNDWMAAFIEQKLNDFPVVKEAFTNILDYRLNIEGMLEYYVKISLEFFDPEVKNKFAEIKPSEAETREKEAQLIEETLLHAYRLFSESLINLIPSILEVPSNSFYARIRKFRERIIYEKEGARDLKNMYREYATIIWKEEFCNIANKTKTINEFNQQKEAFLSNLTKSSFVIHF